MYKFLTILFASVVYFNYSSIDPNLRPINSNIIQEEYDFIIIGAGSAGSVLANRLSEIPEWSVLLIEAGYDENIMTDTPILGYVSLSSPYNWNYTTTFQKGICLDVNGFCELPRGRGLGGTSTINFMVYTRGNRIDYDLWSINNPGWSYLDVLPYFKLSEDNRNYGQPYHGENGYLTVSEPSFVTEMQEIFLKAGREMNYQVGDLNGMNQTGFMKMQGTLRNGSRCSTSKAFLRPIRNRTNLNIIMNSHVTMIDIEGTKGKGVKLIRNNQNIYVRVKKEIILSAGTINTPQILMLSGIGPYEELQKLGIDVKKNLSVGKNLQDHVGTALMFSTNMTTLNPKIVENFKNILNYSKNGLGPLTSPIGLESIAFINLNSNYPDIEIHFSSFDTQPNTWIGNPYLLTPKSIGQVTIKSNNPFDYPVINTNYFNNPLDYIKGLNGLYFLYNLSLSNALQSVNSSLRYDLQPLCPKTDLNQFFKCLLNTYTTTLSHPVGTCKMGSKNDPEAVVNEKLKLYGFDNIRVIDGSIMPRIVRSNVNAPIIMIGERGADLIKIDYGQKPKINV